MTKPARRRVPVAVIVPLLSLLLGAVPAALAQAARDRIGTLGDLSASFQALADKVKPAVVQIFVQGLAPGRGLVDASDLLSAQSSVGSGVILDPAGYVVTNAHVVEGARRVRVLLARAEGPGKGASSILGRKGRWLGAQIVGVDHETDLAVLKLQGFDGGLPHLTLGDSDAVRAGTLVFAFGSPLGLENSVTMGVVSAIARQLRTEDPMIYLQTDAPINPGSSGGPLVDAEGRVVGINSALLSQSGGNEGIGFAAPSNIVRYVFEQIRTTGRVHRGEIGAIAQTITPALAKGLALGRDWGVIVSDVRPGGPAAAAGVEIGDIILSLDGKPMENARQLQVNLYRRPVGGKTLVEVLRDGGSRTLAIEVAARVDDPDRFAGLVSADRNLVAPLGILGIDLDETVLPLLPGLRAQRGVVVAARALKAASLDDQGLLPGDVIYAVNRTLVGGVADLRAALAPLPPGDPVILQVERKGELRFVPMEMP